MRRTRRKVLFFLGEALVAHPAVPVALAALLIGVTINVLFLAVTP